mgnify:CR=1 FL=1
MESLARQLMSHTQETTFNCAPKVTILHLLKMRAQQIDMTKRSVVQVLNQCDIHDASVAARLQAFVQAERLARRDELDVLERCATDLRLLNDYADMIANHRKLESTRFHALLLNV